MDNYNDMARELGYDPTDPEHIEKMQNDFATDDLIVIGLTEEDLAILQADEPGAVAYEPNNVTIKIGDKTVEGYATADTIKVLRKDHE